MIDQNLYANKVSHSEMATTALVAVLVTVKLLQLILQDLKKALEFSCMTKTVGITYVGQVKQNCQEISRYGPKGYSITFGDIIFGKLFKSWSKSFHLI